MRLSNLSFIFLQEELAETGLVVASTALAVAAVAAFAVLGAARR